MPSMAPDPNGIDAAYREYLRVLKEAHRQSNVRYPLEFVHLGYDEFQFGNKLLLGGAENGATVGTGPGSPLGNANTVRFSALDTNFITTYAGSRAQAHAALVNQSIVRRTRMLKNIIGPFTKAMIYADMYDSESNGGFAFRDFSGTSVTLGAPLRGLEGLNDSEKGFFRANVILGMWSWGYTNLDANGGDYATMSSFQDMSNAGFKFIYQAQNAASSSPPPANAVSCSIGGGVTGCDAGMISQTDVYYNVCRNDFRNHCLGYAAMPYVPAVGSGVPGWAEGAHPAHSTIQYLGTLNANDIPASDFHNPFIVPTNLLPNLLK